MKRVKVLIPFMDKEAKKLHKVNDVFEITEERLAEVRTVNVNMVEVLGEVTEEVPEETTKETEVVEAEAPEVEPKKPRKKL